MRVAGYGAIGAAMLGMTALGGCAQLMPSTTAAYRDGGLGAAVGTFLGEAQVVVGTTCRLLDGTALAAAIDLAGVTMDQAEIVDEVREHRKVWCAALGGVPDVRIVTPGMSPVDDSAGAIFAPSAEAPAE